MPHSDRPKSQRQQATDSFNQHMADVASYLAKVRGGRSITAVNPNAPQYSQAADDARLASRGQVPAGYGTTSTPDAIPTQGFGQAFTTPSGTSPTYGFSNTYKPSPQAEAFGYIADHLMDPRVGMAFPGMGMTSRFSNWRNFLRGKPKPDPGGFNVPGNANIDFQTAVRGLNQTVGRWGSPNPLERMAAREEYLNAPQALQNRMDEVWTGSEALAKDLRAAKEGRRTN